MNILKLFLFFASIPAHIFFQLHVLLFLEGDLGEFCTRIAYSGQRRQGKADGHISEKLVYMDGRTQRAVA